MEFPRITIDFTRSLIPLLLIFSLGGCFGDKKNPVLAEIGNYSIKLSELQKYIAVRPPSEDSVAALKERLEELIEDEMFYQEALRLKLDQDPEVRRTIQRLLRQKLAEEKVEKPVLAKVVEEEEVQTYYQTNKNEFERSQQARLSDILIAVPPNTTEERRSDLRAKAETILAEALATQGEDSAFGQLIDKHSDSSPQYPKGDTGYFDEKGHPLQFSPELTQAAFKIERLNRVYDQVIEAPDGFHVIMLVGRRPAVSKELSAVREQIKQQIRYQHLKQAHQEFKRNLRSAASIDINEEGLSQLAEALKQKKG